MTFIYAGRLLWVGDNRRNKVPGTRGSFLHTAPHRPYTSVCADNFPNTVLAAKRPLLHTYTPLARIVAVITPVGSSADKHLTPPSSSAIISAP